MQLHNAEKKQEQKEQTEISFILLSNEVCRNFKMMIKPKLI